MKRKDIMEAIELLSGSQGFYSRLLDAILDLDEDRYNDLMDDLEKQNFKDVIDLVFFFEC